VHWSVHVKSWMAGLPCAEMHAGIISKYFTPQPKAVVFTSQFVLLFYLIALNKEINLDIFFKEILYYKIVLLIYSLFSP